MITVDTSAVFALANRRDHHHESAVAAIGREPEPPVVPMGILAEIAYLIETRLGHHVLDAFLASVSGGSVTVDCGEGDIDRIRELADRYRDLPLGFSDAAVIACGERRGGQVLSFDRRDFDVVAREGSIRVVPEVA